MTNLSALPAQPAMTTTHKDHRAVIEMLVGALKRCSTGASNDGGKTYSVLAEAFDDADAALTAGREALERAHGGGSSLFERAKDLHEKAEMPWAEAEKLALSENGIEDDDIEELIQEHASPILVEFAGGWSDLREYTRALLVHAVAHTQASEPVGINGLTEAETSGSMSVRGLSAPIVGLQSTPADARPVGELTTCNCRWDGEKQVQSCTLHDAHLVAIHEWAGRAKTAERELAAARTQPERVPLPNHTEQANAAHAAASNHTNEIVKLVNAARNGITGGEQ